MLRDGVVGQNLLIESVVDGVLHLGMAVLSSSVSCKCPWCVWVNILLFQRLGRL